jgi:hypothetical protein
VTSHERARRAAYPAMMLVLVSAFAGMLVAGLFLMADGKPLAYFYEVNRVPVSLDDIAPVHVRPSPLRPDPCRPGRPLRSGEKPDVADGVSKILESVMDNGTGQRAKLHNDYESGSASGVGSTRSRMRVCRVLASAITSTAKTRAPRAARKAETLRSC